VNRNELTQGVAEGSFCHTSTWQNIQLTVSWLKSKSKKEFSRLNCCEKYFNCCEKHFNL